MSENNIKVVVRCRPLNDREKARGATPLIKMNGNQTIISKPGQPDKAFTFDESYWSCDKEDPDYADQEHVYNDLGRGLLDHAFDDGQTGSGKSYSMMGYGEDKGIIPRTCLELFDRITQKTSAQLTFQVEVSYIEIYNEKVRDLLNPLNKGNLKVREHPVTGPYVQDLSRIAVTSFENIDQLMDQGNSARTVAATNMNQTSSRSHAVFTIQVTQKSTNLEKKETTEKGARISLVDLAGSERANSTGATGARLKEGVNINKSLTTLGKVIASLAEKSCENPKKPTSHQQKNSKESFVPFRDSVLTWLLKDSLGGNSKTCMIAAISPADYDETMSTLRYADQAKKIKTKAVVNMDPTTKAIGSLKDEIESLRKALMVYAPDEVERIKTNIHGEKKKLARPVRSKSTVVLTEPTGDKVAVELTKEEMESRLKSTENILADINQTWEDKLEKAEKIITEREQMLKSLGISIEKDEISVHMPRDLPCLVSLNEDPLMTECLVYQLKQGMTHVDRLDGQLQRDDHIHTIQLSGIHIQDNHCYFDNIDHTVTLHPTENGTVIVNGISITEPKVLHNGYRITLGDSHVFRFNNPQEKLREIQMQKTDVHADTMTDDETSQLESWNQMRGSSPIHYSIFDKLTDDDIDRLLDDVSKIRFMRKRETSTPDSFYRRRPLSHARTISSICTDDFDQGYYSTDVSTLPSPTCTNYSQHLFLNSSEKHPRPLSIQIPNTLSPSQVVLGKKVVEHWRAKHGASLAQTILYYCDYINHANKKSDIEYRFCIIHDDDHLLRSHWDTNTVDPSLADKKKPCVAIQKIDKKNRSTSTWSIEHFLSQQNESKAAPCYVQVGLAKVPLKSLGSQIPFEMDASLICQTTGQKRGTIKMLLATIARSINRAHKDDSKGLLCVGQQLIFEIRMMEINGVDSEYFSHIHSQFRLSMFGSDGVVTTELLPTNSTVTFNHSQSVSLTVTDEILDALENKHITFEVHGRPTAKYFDQFQQHVSAPSPPLSPVPLETKRVQGILSSIHILELTPLGEYDHVPVQLNKKSIEDGVFSLQQGQQRRIMLSIEHLDKSIFEKVLQMKVGHPRLVDQHGKVLDSSETHIPITLSSSTQLCAQGSWDSSLYGVSFMNRVTPLTQHILLTLTWILQAKDDEPMTFTKEISIRIKDQNEAVKTKKLKRSSSLLRFFSTNAIRQHVTGIFNIEYHGKLMGFSHLWRRYEPCASVLNAYYNARKAIECKEQVERTRHRLGLIKMPIVKSNANPQFVLDLWMDDKHKIKPIINNPLVQPKITRWTPNIYELKLNENNVSRCGLMTCKKQNKPFWCVLLREYFIIYENQNIIDIIRMDNIEHDDANLIATSSTNQYIFEASKPELTREWAIAMNKLVL